MDAESIINTSMLENRFRDYIKQYRALLRWGVDKVFQDSRIDKHFNDVRQLIDARETEKASILLSDLKKQINYLENQYPNQKNEIEKELFVRIQQLESIIEKTTGIDADQIHLYLQTLEIARVAMQNDDWAEAKVKIEAVEMKVLTPNIIEKTRPAQDNSSDKTKKTITPDSNVVSKKVDTTIQAKETKKEINTKKIKVTQHSDKKTGKKLKAQPARKPTDKPISTLSPIAQSIYSIPEKSSIGRLISIQELQKTLNTIDKSQTKTVRIGLFGSSNIINNEVSYLSKKALSIKESGTQVVLLRLSISRKLTIYLIGIPINENANFQQLAEITSQFTSLFINAKNIEKNSLMELSNALSNSVTKNKNIYLKNINESDLDLFLSNDASKEESIYTAIEDKNSRFIEDAAIYMSEYSDN